MKGYLDWITEAEDLDPIKMGHNTNSLEVIYITYEDISDSSFLRFVFASGSTFVICTYTLAYVIHFFAGSTES